MGATGVRLIHGDCLDVLPTLESGSVDAVITDPPYNVGMKYDGDETGDIKADYQGWCRRWFVELRRICKGVIAVSVGQANLSQWAAIEPPLWWLAWWKPAAMGRCVVGFNNWEPIALYGRPKRPMCDVIRATIAPDASLEGHPCPKPLEWALKQIEAVSDAGDTILDPFMGSGTTAVAALRLGRNFIGIEKEPGYYAIAERRVRDERSRYPLFSALQGRQDNGCLFPEE